MGNRGVILPCWRGGPRIPPPPQLQRSRDLAHASIPLAQTPWGLTGRAWLQAGAQRVVIVVVPSFNSLGIDSRNVKIGGAYKRRWTGSSLIHVMAYQFYIWRQAITRIGDNIFNRTVGNKCYWNEDKNVIIFNSKHKMAAIFSGLMSWHSIIRSD